MRSQLSTVGAKKKLRRKTMEEAQEGRKDLFLHTKSSDFPPFSAFDIKQSKKRKTQCFLIVVLAFAIVE